MDMYRCIYEKLINFIQGVLKTYFTQNQFLIPETVLNNTKKPFFVPLMTKGGFKERFEYCALKSKADLRSFKYKINIYC